MGLLFALVVLLLAVFLLIVNTRAGRALELVAAQERELERLQRLVAAGPAPCLGRATRARAGAGA